MLRDNLVGLIEPMQISAGADPLALSIQKQASDDRSLCLENPRPEGVESSLTENVTSPFQAEPTHHLDSAVELGSSDRNSLGHFPHRFLAIAQWFVHLSAYPQPMQQDRQLSCHGHDRSLLGIFPSSLRKLASPSPQITVFSKRSQNVVRSLHHHRAQVPVSFFADALLWFTLPRVPAARS